MLHRTSIGLTADDGVFAATTNMSAVSTDYDSLRDTMVTIRLLPKGGVVLKDGGDLSPVRLGEEISVAELQKLDFVAVENPQRSSEIAGAAPLYVAQNALPAVVSVAVPRSWGLATIIGLPSNGRVLMPDGIPLAVGQVLDSAELKRLLFRPRADSCGKISRLVFRRRDTGRLAETRYVLFIVGPRVPHQVSRGALSARREDVLDPLTAALIAGAALSTSSDQSTAAPAVSIDEVRAGDKPQSIEQANVATVRGPDHEAGKRHGSGASSPANLAQDDVEKPDDVTGTVTGSPSRRIGSSTPPPAAEPARAMLPSAGSGPTVASLLPKKPAATFPRKEDLALASGVAFGASPPAATGQADMSPDSPGAASPGTQAATSPGSSAVTPPDSRAATPPVDTGPPQASSPPVAGNDQGYVAHGGVIAIHEAALLANDVTTTGSPLSIEKVENAEHGSVSYDADARTITFTPEVGYHGIASFSYVVRDADGRTSSATVSLFIAPDESLFDPASAPTAVTVNDNAAVELGVTFVAAADGVITGLRFYKGPQNTGLHVANLWSSNGTLLASAVFEAETETGWQQVDFPNPVAITSGASYIASYHSNGSYSADTGYFASPVVSGDLTATGSVYAYGPSGTFPSHTYNANNYWVDVIYSPSSQAPIAVDDGSFVVSRNGSITIASSALLSNDLSPEGLPLSIVEAGDPSGGAVSYDANTRSVTFVPAAGLTGSASFSYWIADANGGIGKARATVLVADPSGSSLFDQNATPGIVTVGDPNSVELGLEFRAEVNGVITGLRFYKGPDNIGPHVANIWSSTGTLLATATFSNETASGLQQVDFPDPVAVTAGSTYVASYHTNGNYSADPGYFATAHTNGLLTAPASTAGSGNGLFAYGSSSLFPTNSYNATGYGVDVIFRAQLST